MGPHTTNQIQSRPLHLQVVLTKLQPGSLAMADIPSKIAVHTLPAAPLASLYHSIKQVYKPLLEQQQQHQQQQRHEQQSAALSSQSLEHSRLAELLAQLEAGLGSMLRQGQQV